MQESCVEESRIKFKHVVQCAGVLRARAEQMHISLLGLKQEICAGLVWLCLGAYGLLQ